MADDSNLGPDTQTLPQTNYTRGSMPVGGQVAPDLGLSGVQTAMQLAQHSQNLDIQKKQFEMQKEQHQQMAMDKFLEVGSKIGKAKGPYQNVLFDYLQRTAPMAGMPPISEDMISSVKANQDKYSQLMGQLRANPKLMQDPQTMQALYAAHSGDPASLDDQIDKIQSDITKQQGQQLMANALKSKQDFELTKRGVDRDKLFNGTAEEKAIELNKLGAVPASIANKNNAQGAAATANARTNATNAETKQGQAVETNRHNKAAEVIGTERNQVMAGNASTRIQQGQDRLNNTAIKAIQSDLRPVQQTAFAVDKATSLLNKPDVTYGEFKEAMTDYSRALSQSAQNSIVRQSGLENSYNTLENQVTAFIAKNITNNPLKATISPESLSLLRSDLSNLAQTSKAQYESLLRTNLEARRGTGLHPDVVDKLYKVYGVTPPSAGQSSMNLSPGTNPTTPSAPAGAAPKSDQSVNPTPVVQIISPDTIKKAVQINGAEKTRLYLIQKRGYSPADAAAAVGGQ